MAATIATIAVTRVAAAVIQFPRAPLSKVLLRSLEGMALHVRLAGAVLVDPVLDLVAEVAEQALDRPGRRIAQAADGVAFDLRRDVQQHVDLRHLRLAGHHPLHHAPHPAGALTARRALAAA